ncbi:hypothetical protein RFI_29329, partial [Reticulomyxa filosa]
NSIGNSNVICSGSIDNTIRFWNILSNKNQLFMIKGDEKEDKGIICLKFIELKKKEKTKNVKHDLDLCYGSYKEMNVFCLKDFIKRKVIDIKLEKLHQYLKSIINENYIQLQGVRKEKDILNSKGRYIFFYQ